MVTTVTDDNFTKNRHQHIVYWEKVSVNAYSEPVVGNPTELKVRIETDNRQQLKSNADTVRFDLELNVPQEMTIGGVIWIGKLRHLPAPGTDVTAYEIVGYESIPDLKGRRHDRYVQLIRHNERLKLVHKVQLVGLAVEGDTTPTTQVVSTIIENPANPNPIPPPVDVGVVPSIPTLGIAREYNYATSVGPSQPNTIFSWNTAALAQANWDAFVVNNKIYDLQITDDSVGPTIYVGNASTNVIINALFHRFQVPENYQMPELDAQGNFLFDRKTESKRVNVETPSSGVEQKHCMIRPGGNALDFTSDVYYLKPNRRYRCEFTIDFTSNGDMSEAEWDSILSSGVNDIGSWCELFDCHPGSFGDDWIGSVEAPIAFYVYDGVFQLWLRGAIGTDQQYTDMNRYTWDYTHGVHSFILEWEVRHDGSAVLSGSNIKMWMDGDLKVDATQYVGVPGGGSDAGALQMKFGVYGAKATAVFERFVAKSLGVVS